MLKIFFGIRDWPGKWFPYPSGKIDHNPIVEYNYTEIKLRNQEYNEHVDTNVNHHNHHHF